MIAKAKAHRVIVARVFSRISSSTKRSGNSTPAAFRKTSLLISFGRVPVRVLWVCETCGASGEVDTELPEMNLDTLTVEDAATTVLSAVRSVNHPHPVTPRFPALC